jgi:hypothetical protein
MCTSAGNASILIIKIIVSHNVLSIVNIITMPQQLQQSRTVLRHPHYHLQLKISPTAYRLKVGHLLSVNEVASFTVRAEVSLLEILTLFCLVLHVCLLIA